MIRLPDQSRSQGTRQGTFDVDALDEDALDLDALDLDSLGAAAPDRTLLTSVLRQALTDPSAVLTGARAGLVDYAFTSIATGGLFRVAGTADTVEGRRAWSAFVKVLQHPRHWPLIGMLPPELAAELLEMFPWREELATREQVLPVLPPGLQVPELYCVADLAEDRLAVWMEDIDVAPEPWSSETDAAAARLLARLAARRRPGDPAGASDLAPGLAVRKVVESRGPLVAALLGDDSLWQRPLVLEAADASYRDDLRRAFDRLPALLTELDELPSSLPHGDAAPVNLLRPRGRPGTFVLVDWGFGCQLPLGFDIGQLLVGEVERGAMEPDLLPGLHELLVTAYVDGLADEGLHLDPATVRRGSISSLGLRTLLGSFPMELPDEPVTDEDRAFLRRRAGLGRYVVDLVLE